MAHPATASQATAAFDHTTLRNATLRLILLSHAPPAGLELIEPQPRAYIS